MLCYCLWLTRDFYTDICMKIRLAVILEINISIMYLLCFYVTTDLSLRKHNQIQ